MPLLAVSRATRLSRLGLASDRGGIWRAAPRLAGGPPLASIQSTSTSRGLAVRTRPRVVDNIVFADPQPAACGSASKLGHRRPSPVPPAHPHPPTDSTHVSCPRPLPASHALAVVIQRRGARPVRPGVRDGWVVPVHGWQRAKAEHAVSVPLPPRHGGRRRTATRVR